MTIHIQGYPISCPAITPDAFWIPSNTRWCIASYCKQRDNRGNVQEGAGQSDKCVRYYMCSQQQLLDDWIFVLVAGLVVLCICVGERGACVFDVCACPVR